MTRRNRTSRAVENRLDTLETTRAHENQIYAVTIGGDGSRPTGWLSPAEYERHYGDRPESAFSFTVNPSGEDS